MRVLAIVWIAIPFVFGGVRWASTGTDWRFVCAAFVALMGATLVLRRAPSTSSPSLFMVAVAVAVSSASAALCAVLVGATAGGAIATVAIGFGICCVGGVTLWMRSRGRLGV